MVPRQQISGIDLYCVDTANFYSLLSRKVFPKCLDQRIAGPGSKQNCDDRKFVVLALVDQVRHHWIIVAVNLPFAGPVKMKLYELVSLATDGD